MHFIVMLTILSVFRRGNIDIKRRFAWIIIHPRFVFVFSFFFFNTFYFLLNYWLCRIFTNQKIKKSSIYNRSSGRNGILVDVKAKNQQSVHWNKRDSLPRTLLAFWFGHPTKCIVHLHETVLASAKTVEIKITKKNKEIKKLTFLEWK